MFERFADVPVALSTYQQVLAGHRVPRELQAIPVVDLGQFPHGYRFAGGTQEEQLAYRGIDAVLSQKHPVMLSSVLGTSYGDRSLRASAYFLNLGTPGSPQGNGYGGTLRAMWLPGQESRAMGFFGLTLRPVGLDQDSQVRTEAVVGFRLIISSRVAPEVAQLWVRLSKYWPIPQL